MTSKKHPLPLHTFPLPVVFYLFVYCKSNSTALGQDYIPLENFLKSITSMNLNAQ